MAVTNFAALTTEQKTAWSMKFWRHMRNRSFLDRYSGNGESSIIQRISELTRDEKGARAVLTLIADSKGDGVASDNQLEGNEEEIQSSDIVITMDQLRHAHRHKGKMADQKSIVNFRGQALNNLSYWMSDRLDQMALLTLSGISYSFATNGATRVGSQLPVLEFAADVTAPTAYRNFRWDYAGGTGSALLRNDANSNLAAEDTLTWNALLDLKTQAEYYKVKPIRGEKDGIAYYQVFIHPMAMNSLKKDSDYLANIRNAGVRGDGNALWKGTDSVMVDGMLLTPFHHSFTTLGAVSGSGKWGSGSDVDGARILLCGGQALGMADIGRPTWVEKEFDYDNQPGISVGKIFGFKKPKFTDPTTETVEDFGVMTLDVAI